MATRKFAIAKQLGGKRVITNKGEEIGRLSDVQIDEHGGDLEYVLVEPNMESKAAAKLTQVNGMLMIPFKAVFAVSDVIVVDETMLH